MAPVKMSIRPFGSVAGMSAQGGDRSETRLSVTIFSNLSVRAREDPRKKSFSSWFLGGFCTLMSLIMRYAMFVVERSSGLEACREISTGPNRPSVLCNLGAKV